MSSRKTSAIRTFGERYHCHSCGRCCRRWKIPVDADRVQRLRRHDWTRYGIPDPFVRSADGYFLRMVGDRCVFLDDNQKCRIHSDLSYEEKPAACRAFPLHLATINGVTAARLSFYCPAVCANDGILLSRQSRWLTTTLREAGDIVRREPLTLDGTTPVSWSDQASIERRLLSLLQNTDLSMADRLCAGTGFLRRLTTHSTAVRSRSIAAFCAETPDLPELLREGRLGGSRSEGRTVLSLFLGQDTVSGALRHRMGQFFNVRLAGMGLVPLSSGSMRARARFSQIQRLAFSPSLEAAGLIDRYILSKIQSGRYLMGNASIRSGWQLLGVGFAILSLLARLRATANARSGCSDEDVEMAVQSTDLLVFEHARIVQSPVLGTFIDRMLNSEALTASVMDWIDCR
jgi:Fe-S-cluster containining protein